MSASSADRISSSTQAIATVDFPVKASTTIYQYEHVCIDTSVGYAVPAADSANLIHVGQAIRQANNSSGSSGDISVPVVLPANERYHLFDASSADVTWTGKLVCFSDDHTVALASTTTNDVYAGRVLKYISATKVLVDTADKITHSATGGVY